MLGDAMCVYVCICMRWGVFGCAFKKKKKNKCGAICMGLMHSTPQSQQEQYNTVVKAMSQPFCMCGTMAEYFF